MRNGAKSEKTFPKDAVDFCSTIDNLIYQKFSLGIELLHKMGPYSLHGLFEVNDHFFDDRSLHLAELFSAQTIESARQFLRKLKALVDSQVELINSK